MLGTPVHRLKQRVAAFRHMVSKGESPTIMTEDDLAGIKLGLDHIAKTAKQVPADALHLSALVGSARLLLRDVPAPTDRVAPPDKQGVRLTGVVADTRRTGTEDRGSGSASAAANSSRSRAASDRFNAARSG